MNEATHPDTRPHSARSSRICVRRSTPVVLASDHRLRSDRLCANPSIERSLIRCGSSEVGTRSMATAGPSAGVSALIGARAEPPDSTHAPWLHVADGAVMSLCSRPDSSRSQMCRSCSVPVASSKPRAYHSRPCPSGVRFTLKLSERRLPASPGSRGKRCATPGMATS